MTFISLDFILEDGCLDTRPVKQTQTAPMTVSLMMSCSDLSASSNCSSGIKSGSSFADVLRNYTLMWLSYSFFNLLNLNLGKFILRTAMKFYSQ